MVNVKSGLERELGVSMSEKNEVESRLKETHKNLKEAKNEINEMGIDLQKMYQVNGELLKQVSGLKGQNGQLEESYKRVCGRLENSEKENEEVKMVNEK